MSAFVDNGASISMNKPADSTLLRPRDAAPGRPDFVPFAAPEPA
jgi:hypothetical protein